MTRDIIVSIQLKNWAKHQERLDVKNPSWFRKNNKTHFDAKIIALSDEEFRIFDYILCEASAQNKQGKIDINLDIASMLLRKDRTVIMQAIEKFKKLGFTARVRAVRGALEERRVKENKEEETEATRSSLDSDESSTDEIVLEFKKLRFWLGDNVLKTLKETFPSQRLIEEATKMRVWLVANPTRGPKSEKGMPRFVANWMNRDKAFNGPKKTFSAITTELETL